jgi:F-type H+-transporting ATPase subunit epsilon
MVEAHADRPARSLQCVIVTPERTVLDAKVESVVLPMYDGEAGILPGRAALIGRLGPGELRTRQAGVVKRYFVDGGFAQVRANVVTVLTPRAQPAENIDTQAASQVLQPTAGATTEARARAEQRARVQLRIARRARGEPMAASH